MYGGMTLGQRPYTTLLRTQTLGNPSFVVSRQWFAPLALRTGQKTTIPAHTAAEDRRQCQMHAKQDSSTNIFRVRAAHRKEPASLFESIVLTNRSSAGSDYLLNGLPWWI